VQEGQKLIPSITHVFRWISCKLHTRIGSRCRAAIASTAARAPLMVVMQGTR
jgi:hypothetical protein